MKNVVKTFLILMLLVLTAINAFAAQLNYAGGEICGDGYDNNASGYTFGSCPVGWMNTVPWATAGCDKLCPGNDADMDGYPAANDCDDNDRNIFPTRSTIKGCSGGQWKYCVSNGTTAAYTGACSASVYTCHSGSGATYYVDPALGSDSNLGSNAFPWATVLPWSDSSQVGYHAPVAGDCLTIKSNTTYTGKYDADPTAGISYHVMRMYFAAGTPSNPIKIENYPGFAPKFAPAGCNSTNTCTVIRGEFADNIQVRGLDVTSGYGVPVSTTDGSDNFTLEGMHIHDADCFNDNNCCGVKITGSAGLIIKASDIHDNYDRILSDSNDSNVFIFDQGSALIKGSTIWNTLPGKSGCVIEKHGYTTGNLYTGNTAVRCALHAPFALSSIGSVVEKNRIFESAYCWGLRGDDPFYKRQQVFQDNFCDAGATGMYGHWALADDTYPPTAPSLTVRRNVIVGGPATVGDGALIGLQRYGTLVQYNAYYNSTYLDFQDNCYYSTTMNLNTSTDFADVWFYLGAPGAAKTFPQWTANGRDAGSFVGDPTANTANDFVAASVNCTGKGAWPTTLSPTPTPTPTPANSVGAGTFSFGRFK